MYIPPGQSRLTITVHTRSEERALIQREGKANRMTDDQAESTKPIAAETVGSVEQLEPTEMTEPTEIISKYTKHILKVLEEKWKIVL